MASGSSDFADDRKCVVRGCLVVQASWSPDSVGAQNLRSSNLDKFQVYADGGAMLTQEVRAGLTRCCRQRRDFEYEAREYFSGVVYVNETLFVFC